MAFINKRKAIDIENDDLNHIFTIENQLNLIQTNDIVSLFKLKKKHNLITYYFSGESTIEYNINDIVLFIKQSSEFNDCNVFIKYTMYNNIYYYDLYLVYLTNCNNYDSDIEAYYDITTIDLHIKISDDLTFYNKRPIIM
jgi:hypothetical protein